MPIPPSARSPYSAPGLSLGLLLSALGLLGLPGCEAPDRIDNEATEDLARAAGDDIARLSFVVEDVARAAGDLTEAGARETAQVCEATVGDCSFCYSLDGGYLGGEFSAESTPEPCGDTWTLRSAVAEYAVATSVLSGTWDAESLAGDYTIEATGTRSATLSTQGRLGSNERDVSWTLTSLTASTVDFALSSVSLAMTYGSVDGHAWDLALTGDAAGPQGTLSVDNGTVTCQISGEWETVNLNCE